MEEYGSCIGPHTKCNSPFVRDKVPKKWFRVDPENPRSKSYKSCFHCRRYVAQRKINNPKVITETNSDYKKCSCNLHSHSTHPKDKVPSKMFLKDPENPKSKILSYCSDCRSLSSIKSKQARIVKALLTQQTKELLQNTNSEFGYCGQSIHDTVVMSIYPRDKVPKEMFRMEPDNPHSELYDQCSDCRKYKAEKLNNWKQSKRAESEANECFRCYHCHKEFPENERAPNLDGTLSVHCFKCKDMQNIRNDRRAEYYRTIQLEFMNEMECSCFKCKSVFLQPIEGTLAPIKLNTFEKNGKRYLIYDGVTYKVTDFFEKYNNLLETSILPFDHLPEDEQRKRGLLQENEVYIPKRYEISSAMSDTAKRLESKKCQLTCLECHMIETDDRSNALRNNQPLKLNMKQEYVNTLKLAGCSSCGYKNDKLLRFFHMDHLHPETKRAHVSTMARTNSYTFEETVEECEDCRVLCGHCHIIHTRNQIQEGMFLPNFDEYY